ncbi:MAG TPA: hypothetical protein VF661_05770 [Actinomycetales bacterium]|jgi:hypothetical protein
MQSSHLRRSLLQVVAALAAGALGGYLAALIRPRPALAYASDYHAPHPDAVALRLDVAAGERPAATEAPVDPTGDGSAR